MSRRAFPRSSPSPRGRERDPAGEARQANRLAGGREEGQPACLSWMGEVTPPRPFVWSRIHERGS